MRNLILLLPFLLLAACEQVTPVSQPSVGPSASSPAPTSPVSLDTIKNLASTSSCVAYNWKDRGHASKGYVSGVALTFGRAVCQFSTSKNQVVAKKMDDVAESKRDVYDAISWYNSNFTSIGMSNAGGDLATLRHVYTLLLGLGMRESSGQYCCGRDSSASNTSSDSAEAGAWQTSYDSHSASSELPKLFAVYQASGHPNCFLDTFKAGVSCSASNLKNWGSGAGLTFQATEKECPAFSAEYAAIMLRVDGGRVGHYGPIRQKAAEIKPECDALLQKVQALVQSNAAYCDALK